jgi:hypothetical protein
MGFKNRVGAILVLSLLHSSSLIYSFARLLLLTRLDQPGVANVASVPTGERPILNEPGIHHYLDLHIGVV